ncbi:MAG: Asp-tRNA(Asn)/Glu-tRNA(Gln) amidotransferase GatCAB subunit B, partial [Bacteroidetes bacterium]|nr:Asp-tRNA(Asn)/Glu-tRNA(Gln) amidotransferase GatCAB subunit B [Bacteroidota bacterium]
MQAAASGRSGGAAARRARLVEQWGISGDDAEVLLGVAGLADYAEATVAAGATGADATKWIVGDVLGFLHEKGVPIQELALAPDGLAELLNLLADGTLNRNLAREVLAVCLAEPKRPRAVVDERGLAQVSDEGEL